MGLYNTVVENWPCLMATEMSKNSTETGDILYVNLMDGWKFWTKWSSRTDSECEQAPIPSSINLLYNSGMGPVKDCCMRYSRWPMNRQV